VYGCGDVSGLGVRGEVKAREQKTEKEGRKGGSFLLLPFSEWPRRRYIYVTVVME
jgi:hypothetical protein